ncbi:MAG: beta-galactosidase [Suipraeoptans sp.]
MSLHFGVDYYPEHWPRQRWGTDAELMKEMGLQLVRLGEFSWHKMEPEEGKYEFSWLDDAINLFGKSGIKVVLGTPSAAPPAWMVNKYPEVLPQDRQGRARGFGGRHHDCQSSPKYRELIRKLVTELAQRYGRNEYVIGWQPDNELGNSHEDLCTCGNCRKRYQTWLKKKYQTVDNLNNSWGNAFWSQEYNCFEEVFTPQITVAGENPSAMLDWKCFCSDLIVEFLKEQTDIIRKYCPTQFITHNYMGFANKVDYYDLAKPLDFVSHDQYPGGFYGKQPQVDAHELAAILDVVRSYKNKNFWIMEQQSGITGWDYMGRAPQPGQLSGWVLQSIAHGADTIVFFRWRTCSIGTEQYWHGILPHSGIPGRRYEELKTLVHEMTPIMEQMQGSMPSPDVGIVFSFRQEYAFQIQPHNPELSYTGQIKKYYKALYEEQIAVDFVPEDRVFSKYKLLIAPLQYLMTPELEDKYLQYVKNGGHLILTMRTGVKDEHNICMTERQLPGRLSDLTGIEVLDYDCLRDTSVKINYNSKEYSANIWSDLLHCSSENTKVLASYASEYYKGDAVVTKHCFGEGSCYYIGTEPDEELMAALLSDIADSAEVERLGSTDAGVELATRQQGDCEWLFAINHSNIEKSFKIDSSYQMIRGEEEGRLKSFEVQIFIKNK